MTGAAVGAGCVGGVGTPAALSRNRVVPEIPSSKIRWIDPQTRYFDQKGDQDFGIVM